MPPADPATQDQPDSPGPDEPDSSASPSGASDADPLRVELIDNTQSAGSLVDGWLDEHVRRALALCDVGRAQINLVIVFDAEMAELHQQYTGVAGTTDVLTFDLRDAAHDAPLAGAPASVDVVEADIVLCLDEAERQAKQRGHEPRHELLLYAVHGLLHLLGEDDHTEQDFQRMHAREDKLLTQLGFTPLFNPER